LIFFPLIDKRIDCEGETSLFANGGKLLSKNRQSCMYYDGEKALIYNRGITTIAPVSCFWYYPESCVIFLNLSTKRNSFKISSFSPYLHFLWFGWIIREKKILSWRKIVNWPVSWLMGKMSTWNSQLKNKWKLEKCWKQMAHATTRFSRRLWKIFSWPILNYFLIYECSSFYLLVEIVSEFVVDKI